MNTPAPSVRKLPFASDYAQGAHPFIIECLAKTNMEATPGYGTDAYCASARDLIRDACEAPEAEVHFLIGGTQANKVALDALLAPWQGVVAARSGHVSIHEAGAIEAGGHKVLEIDGEHGKLSAAAVDAFVTAWEHDGNRDHMVMPGVVYISQPTEYGTLYARSELEALRNVCDAHGLKLYVDGARLAYALAAPANDVTLPDLARLADAFYIGGTKCGALLGEAMVFPHPGICPHFFTFMKQEGALLAKGRLLGIQFECLFADGLYERIGKAADVQAARIAEAFRKAGCELVHPQETNQVFVALTPEQEEKLSRICDMSFWERTADGRVVYRLATSWASAEDDADALVFILGEL